MYLGILKIFLICYNVLKKLIMKIHITLRKEYIFFLCLLFQYDLKGYVYLAHRRCSKSISWMAEWIGKSWPPVKSFMERYLKASIEMFCFFLFLFSFLILNTQVGQIFSLLLLLLLLSHFSHVWLCATL